MAGRPKNVQNTQTQDEKRRDGGFSEPIRRFVCPMCKRPIDLSPEGAAGLPRFFPFCSERCRLIDLGAWLDADYRIPAKPDEESEEAMGEGPSDDLENPRS